MAGTDRDKQPDEKRPEDELDPQGIETESETESETGAEIGTETETEARAGAADEQKQLSARGEAEVRILARSRARRSLTLTSREERPASASGESEEEEEEEIPVQRVGWVDVPGEVRLDWKANPWRARPGKLSLLVAIYVGLFLFAYWMAPQDYLLLAIIPVILLASASRHLLPSRYIITTEGIYWYNFMDMMFRPWLAIEDFVFTDEMGELFFDTKTIRSRIQRGISVYYNGNRTEVESLIRELHDAKWEKLRSEVRQRQGMLQEDDEDEEGEEESDV